MLTPLSPARSTVMMELMKYRVARLIGRSSATLFVQEGARTGARPDAPAAAPGAATPGPAASGTRPIKPMRGITRSARVNGEAIERWEFDNAVKRIEARAGGPVPPEKRDEVLRGVLDQLVAYHLLAQESRARKIAIGDPEVEARLADIRKSFPSEDAFTKGIASQGLTPEHLRLQTRTSLEVAEMLDAESRRRSWCRTTSEHVLPAEPRALKQVRQRQREPHPLGVAQDATPAQRPKRRPRRRLALKQVRAGADFATIAKAVSQDPGSAPNGGDLGFFPKGQMNPQFEDAAFGTKTGAVSPVVETPFGFHIIKVHGRRAPRTAPLTEVSGQIKDFLTQGQREQKLEQFVEQVKAKGKIEILI